MSGSHRSRVVRKLEGLAATVSRSSQFTRLTGSRSVLVPEFPRSGGTWISKVVGCALDMPVPQRSVLPIAMPSVLHGHFLPSRVGPACPVLLVYRDGRDVYVSLLHHMRSIESAKYLAKRCPNELKDLLVRPVISPSDVAANMADFLEWQAEDPWYAGSNWGEFYEGWMSADRGPHSRLVTLSYEAMLNQPARATLEALQRLVDDCPNEQIISACVERFDFRTVSGREPGDVDASSFMRSGTAGTWRESFDSHAETVFERLYGGVSEKLISFGVES